MVRRKRRRDDGLRLPPALLPAVAARDPEGWRTARFEWARSHDWGAQRLGLLRFFDETVYWHWTARGLVPPIGSVQRYEAALRGYRGDVPE